MTALDSDTQRLLTSLRKTATNVLEKKRRLGHYAVIWKEGAPLAVGEDAPSQEAPTPEAQNLKDIQQKPFYLH